MQKVDFENGKITENIARNALPMLVAQVLNLLYNIVDRIYIGRIPEVGTAALGAVGLCFPVILIVTAFTNMFGLGGSPLFAMSLGAKDKKKAGEVLNTSFRLLILIGLIIFVVVEVIGGWLLTMFGATENELTYSLPYLRVYVAGTVFSMISTGMNPFINAQGYASIGMVTVVIGAVSNLILDPIFIFALGMGVVGAALATVLSQLFSAFFVMRFFLGEKNEFPLQRPSGVLFPYAGEIVGLGTAPFVMQITNSLVSITCNSTLMRCGGAISVSAMTIISSVRQIVEVPILAIGEGASPVISYNYGARRPARIRKAIAVMLAMSLPYCLVIWIMILVTPRFFVSIFTHDEELLVTAIPFLHTYFFAFIFQALQYAGQTVFKALGKKKRNVFFSLFRKVVLVVPLTLLLPTIGFGTDGVFMAEPISNVLGGTACFVTMLLTILPELRKMEK